MSEPDYDRDMQLPKGKTCADCYASRFCVGIGCTTPERTRCDYWPNRFRLRSPTPESETTSTDAPAETRGD